MEQDKLPTLPPLKTFTKQPTPSQGEGGSSQLVVSTRCLGLPALAGSERREPAWHSEVPRRMLAWVSTQALPGQPGWGRQAR